MSITQTTAECLLVIFLEVVVSSSMKLHLPLLHMCTSHTTFSLFASPAESAASPAESEGMGGL